MEVANMIKKIALTLITILFWISPAFAKYPGILVGVKGHIGWGQTSKAELT